MSDSIDDSMFGKAVPKIFNYARELRERLTQAERLLWEELREKKLESLKFRRQHPFDSFILDFYCHEIKLCIELDGGIHNDPDQKKYDIEREMSLLNANIMVIRFENEEVIYHLPMVLDKINEVVGERKKDLNI
jgi:very-short-patch-repair endonuclease